MGLRHAPVLFAIAAFGLLSPGAARADRVPSGLIASSQDGQISLAFVAEPNMPVQFGELVGGVEQPLATVTTDAQGLAPLINTAQWRCDRLERTFTAHGTAADGEVYSATYDLKTPSCATRLTLTTPRHVDRTRPFGVRIVDGFKLGDVSVDVCVQGAGIARGCKRVKLSRSANGVVTRLKAPASGHVRIAVELAGTKTVRTVAVGTAKPVVNTNAPVLLATGDSTIQGIDSFLADDLGSGTRVLSDFHVGTGITTPGTKTWKQYARSQAARRPDVVVISIGANEGYPLDGAECCGDAWTTAYTAYLKVLMKTYERGGKGHVVWLTLPAPQDPRRQVITNAVNSSIRAAAAGDKNVLIVDLGKVFTPDGQFHSAITYKGKQVTVREEDGLHLNVAGTKIAAETALAALRPTGWLR